MKKFFSKKWTLISFATALVVFVGGLKVIEMEQGFYDTELDKQINKNYEVNKRKEKRKEIKMQNDQTVDKTITILSIGDKSSNKININLLSF